MGLFNRDREEEFLDEDEKRLRRESKERNRRAHADCAADHEDDGRYQRPYTNPTPKPHDDCKADHSDDHSRRVNTGYSAPHNSATNSTASRNTTSYNSAPRTNTVNNPRPANSYSNVDNGNIKRVFLIIIGVFMFSIVAQMLIAMLSMSSSFAKYNNKREEAQRQMEIIQMSVSEEQERRESSVNDISESVNDTFNQTESIMIIQRVYGSNHYSREELIDRVMAESSCSREVAEMMVSSFEEKLNIDYELNAIFVLHEEDPNNELSDGEAQELLRSHGFTDSEIEAAIDNRIG